ncbi:hypothetical protein [Thermus islandicus]|uniref:hypothetical protein n=1 Tax=Thermus islandicus TaxID=540988 RepID=UPI0003B68CB7|nr:hypothetical protein [Thermus islandicus]
MGTSWNHLEAPGSFTLIPNPLLVKLFKSGLSDREIAVFLALATRRNLRYQKAIATRDLALFLGRDPRTVEKALLTLWEKGLVERNATGWWVVDGEDLSPAAQQGMPEALHAVQPPLQTVPGEAAENTVLDSAGPEPKEKEKQTYEAKTPSSSTGAEAAAEEGMAPEPDPHTPEAATGAEAGQGASPAPFVVTDRKGPRGVSPALVKDGTKWPLQAALKRAGLWEEFYRTFRPGFAHQGLWRAYLGRLEREGLPLGEGFLLALDRTLKGAALGVVRYPAAYLDRLLQDFAPSEGPPQEEGEVEVPKDALLVLPDGRRGYFAGWTGGGAKAFFEVDGVAHLVERELVLAARVVG